LEEQFKKREVFNFEGGKVEIVDVKPEHQKTEVPVMVIPGWAGTLDGYKDFILELAQEGREALGIGAMHGIEHKFTEDNFKNISDAILRHIAALNEVVEAKGIKEFDVAAHSMSAITAAFYAKLFPGKIRNFFPINPAGMMGKDSFWRMFRDFQKDAKAQEEESAKVGNLAQAKEMARGVSKAIRQHPIKIVREVFAMANMQIHDILKELHEQGVGIVVIHSADDRGFPMERIQETSMPEEEDVYIESPDASTEELAAILEEPGETTKISLMKGFISTKGLHARVCLDGKAIGKWVDHLLTALEKKKEKNGEI